MWILYILLGLAAGLFGGTFGLGGGAIIVPSLVYFFGFTQHQAQGTSLAIMVPPIALLAAMKYYSQGNVKLGVALFVCLGFFVGGLLGAQYAHKLSDPLLRKLFGIFLFFVAIKMILGK